MGDPPDDGVPSRPIQSETLAAEMDTWLALFDQDLALEEVALSQRPMRALISLFVEGAIQLYAGEETIDTSRPHEHAKSLWFRVLYQAVEHWYVDRFGAAAMKGKGRCTARRRRS